jgi:hypothetical protein
VDLEVELHPLAIHVHARNRLLTEAVRSLKGKRLKAMIPPLIKVFQDYLKSLIRIIINTNAI